MANTRDPHPQFVNVKTLIDGDKIEPVAVAAELAIQGAVAELEEATPPDMQSAENIHDALSRLGALSQAGAIGKIT